jgi:hypothetical protein
VAETAEGKNLRKNQQKKGSQNLDSPLSRTHGIAIQKEVADA